MKLPLFILFFTLISLRLTAQNDSWEYFNASSIECLAAKGNTILAGTNGAGIVRFDTLSNRSFFNTGNSAIPSDSILQLTIDAAGDWWMQHPGGISRFDGTNVQTWSLAQTGLPATAAIRALKAAPDSSVYAATDNGVAIFRNGAWSVLNMSNSGLPSNNIWDLAFGPDGKIYFATFGSGIVVQDGANWTSYTTANTGISPLNNVLSVALTTDGTLWAFGALNATVVARLVKFEAGTWTGYSVAAIGITSPGFFRKMQPDAFGRLWVTTNNTVSVIQQGVWTHYDDEEDIGCNSDETITPAVDGAGQIWVENYCQLSRFNGQIWSKPGTGLPGPPLGVFYDGIAEGADGSMWFGTEFGEYIAHQKDDAWEQYYPTDFGASYNDVFSVQADSAGQMWFGLGNAEILRYADGAWTFFDTCAVAFPNFFVSNSAAAPNGDRWFALNSPQIVTAGLARYSATGQWQFFTPDNSPLPPNFYIRKILIDVNGVAWFSTSYKGILRYDGITWDSLTQSNSGLPDNRVYFLAEAPDGAIWACTDSGLARFDGQNWTTLNTDNSGLPSNEPRRIAFDQAGGMYVTYWPAVQGATGATTVVLRGGVWTELTPPGWENTANEAADAFIVDSQNRLWFAEFTGPGCIATIQCW